jgi:hypothetical protein
MPRPLPWCFAFGLLGACATPTAQVADVANVATVATAAAPICRPSVSLDTAASDLGRASAAIAHAGEHPFDADLDVILPLLSGAARSGLIEAQQRYGTYVFGYWATDEMFWPGRPDVAIEALGLLRVAALRHAAAGTLGDDALLRALSTTPPAFTDDVPAPPQAWIDAAVVAADQWLACHPGVVDGR